MNLSKKILQVLGKDWMTATWITYEIDGRFVSGGEPWTKLSSVSSLLRKMYDAGIIQRADLVGPRGGHAYRIPPPGRMGYCFPAFVQDCIDAKMDHPEDRLCAFDEWPQILRAWMQECTGDDVDRYLRLHTILSRCLHG